MATASNQTDTPSPPVTRDSAAPAPLENWKWLREWIAFAFGLIASVVSIFLFFENQRLKSVNNRIEANATVNEAWKLLLGDDEAIYSPSERPASLREANGLLDNALLRDPENPLATRYKSIALLAQGKTDEAAEAAKKAVSLDPKSFEAHIAHANVLLEAGNLEEALVTYDKAISLNQKNSIAFANKGNIFRTLERFQESANMYRKATNKNPRDFRSFNNLGFCLEKLGKTTEAEAAYRDGLEANPESSILYFNLGNILADQGKIDDALNAYRTSLSLDPSHLLGNLPILPAEKGALELSRDSAGNWQLALKDRLAGTVRADEIESRPYDEPGSPKSASLWEIDDGET